MNAEKVTYRYGTPRRWVASYCRSAELTRGGSHGLRGFGYSRSRWLARWQAYRGWLRAVRAERTKAGL